MRTTALLPLIPCFAAACSSVQILAKEVSLAGAGGLRQWHKITLTLAGPPASEDGDPNPFLDYRFEVTFTHPATGLRYLVPGYFAADGDAANTSARSGVAWRAHLAPDHAGIWEYPISFRQGKGIAVSDLPLAGTPLAPFDGAAGSFTVLPTDKTGRDLRGKGRLEYIGKHHLRFADGEYFLRIGADSPENFLAYEDFDYTPNTGGLHKSWAPYLGDWRAGDPSWKGGKGMGIIGALNYLSSKGPNAFSFLTYSFNGDDKNVFPHAHAGDFLRMDCSKLDQWEIVFEHADRAGLFLHFKTQETAPVRWAIRRAIRGATGWCSCAGGPAPPARRSPATATRTAASTSPMRCVSSSRDPGNTALLDFTGGGENPSVDISDAVALLQFLFLQGPPHFLGSACVAIAGCPFRCST